MSLITLSVLAGAVFMMQVPVFGNTTLGYYYIEAYLGEQRAPQSLILDTGSDKTLTDCDPCQSCGSHMHPHYKPTREGQRRSPQKFESFLCGDSSCSFYQSYSEGSEYAGNYFRDAFRFNKDDRPFEAVLGCVSKETGLFVTQEADGIFGISAPRYNVQGANFDPPSPVESAIIQGQIPNHVMSICLASDGGKLSFGGMNTELHVPGKEVATVKVDPSLWTDQYKLNILSMSVAGIPLGYSFDRLNKNSQQGFFDTGTTFAYFPSSLMERITQAFDTFCSAARSRCGGSSGFQRCYRNGPLSLQRDESFVSSFPDLTFTLEGPHYYVWRPANYMIKSGRYDFCVTFDEGDALIFGASFFKNYDVSFDKQNYQMAFVEADCAPGKQPYRHLQASRNGRNDHFNGIIHAYNKELGMFAQIANRWDRNYLYIFLAVCVLAVAGYFLHLRLKLSQRIYQELIEMNEN